MAILNIVDDRDVYNYMGIPILGNTQNTQEILTRLKAENSTCGVVGIGNNRFIITMPVITCTGSNDTNRVNIPYMHSLEKLEIKHTDSVNANSSNNLSYSVSKSTHANLQLLIFSIDNSIAYDIIDEFIGYYERRGQYKITTNSTNTDRLYIAMTIQVNGD